MGRDQCSFELLFGVEDATNRVGTKAGNVVVPFGAYPRNVIHKIGSMREDLLRGEDNEYNSRIYNLVGPRIEYIYYTRPTLGASCKKMYADGESIGLLYYVNGVR